MDAYARKGVIIIRTIQRPFLYPIYNKCAVAVKECLDYRLIPAILWQSGIKANVEFVHYKRRKIYDNLQEIELEMQHDLGKETFEKNKIALRKCLTKFMRCNSGVCEVNMSRITEFIYWKKLYAKD